MRLQPFTGEEMTCVLCGKRQLSDLSVESNWRCIELQTGQRYYACPSEFPPDGATTEEFKQAYLKVLTAVIAKFKATFRGRKPRLKGHFINGPTEQVSQ